MEITVTINAPDLVNAINALAVSIAGQNNNGSVFGATINNLLDAPAPAEQLSPVSGAPADIPITPAMPFAMPPTQQPVLQTPVPALIPTSAPTYTMEQLAVAATQLVDAGRRTELVSLLASFGVQALTALPKEQYGAFATQLRAMGAKI